MDAEDAVDRDRLDATTWPNKIGRVIRVCNEIYPGNLWINTHFSLSHIAHFGGHKESPTQPETGLNILKAFYNVQ